MDQFSFNGHRCTEFGLRYAPSAKERWLTSAPYNVVEEKIFGRPGGCWYGTDVAFRDFSLTCYFEDEHEENLEKIHQWMDRNAEGWLIFEERPEVRYRVRPVDVVGGEVWERNEFGDLGRVRSSGRVTLKFRAYEAFGEMTFVSYEGEIDPTGASNRCGVVQSRMMPPDPLPIAGRYLIYNPGTERTFPLIRIRGKAPKGLAILNHTTGERCTLSEFQLAEDTWLEIDGRQGDFRIQPLGRLAFEYHVDGYIALAPCTPYMRNLFLSLTAGSNEATLEDRTLGADWQGAYVFLEGQWKRIALVREDGEHIVLDSPAERTESVLTMAARMNEIEIAGDDLELEAISFDYVPLVR